MLPPDNEFAGASVSVAILPASAKNRDVLPGWTLEWSRVFDNEFAGASVSVVILAATR